ncbi:MAG TPA: competence protein [Candidatus Levilactobacillus faecigallinarum]|uniref:Competence protein n=1 Tax=Candidatus Levilactobacillus faecigallinarum TaxID=2838638 RepID=A0A9D1U500_9LACO|nr:competence protein [Candidatus Levilactobacillus faecigallinarum]
MLLAEWHRHLVDAQDAARLPDYQCPTCHEPVRLHRGHQVPPYFAHLPRSACQIISEHESPEHVRGKRQLARFFAPWGPTSFERVLPAIHQRADVWIARKGGPVALEFQCSPLSNGAVAQRTRGYYGLGVRPLWLLGSPYAHQRLGWSLIERFACWLPGWGLCLLFWDVRQDVLVVHHHLHQTAAGDYAGWDARLRSVVELQVGRKPVVTQATVNLPRLRRRWAQAILQGDAGLRPIIEQLYLTGHHLAGFPPVLTTTQTTAPIFGRGLLLWRIVMGAWLFARPTRLTPEQVTMFGQSAFRLVGGRTAGVQFTARRVLPWAQKHLMEDLVRAELLRPTPKGWAVTGTPRWFRDYHDWLKNG